MRNLGERSTLAPLLRHDRRVARLLAEFLSAPLEEGRGVAAGA